MFGWLRTSPGLLRALALTAATVLLAQLASRTGGTVDWETAIVYGVALAIAIRWPVIMPRTGARIVFIAGLLIEALWHHGLYTAVALAIIEPGVRMLVAHEGRQYWEWYRPFFGIGALTGAYGLHWLLAGQAAMPTHTTAIMLDASAITMVYVYWILLNFGWTVMGTPVHGWTRTQELIRRVQQTWWAPLCFVVVAWSMQSLHSTGYHLEIVACILLVWIQSVIGPIFSTLHQDAAVTQLGRSAGEASSPQSCTVHRVLRTAHTIGRTLGLPPHDLRLLGYAAVLQEEVPDDTGRVPFWLPAPPDAAQLAAVREQVKRATERVASDGALHDVAHLIGFRYASYDGHGYPAVAGEAIPLTAQVLSAANAVVYLTRDPKQFGLTTGAAAVDWLSAHAPGRFSPRMMGNLRQAFRAFDPVVDVARGLPETVRHLRRLLNESDEPPTFFIGLRHIWQQLRGRARLGPDLPAEVQAVARLATYFVSSTDITQIAQITVDAVGQLLGAKVSVALRERDATELSLTIRAAYGFNEFHLIGRTFEILGGPLNRAILDQSPIQVPDMREFDHPVAQETVAMEGVRSGLFVPLVHRGRTVGMLFINLQRQHWFTPREVNLILLMAGQAAAALENARLIAEAAERVEHISQMKAFTDILLDNLSSSIIVVDPQGRLVMANAFARTRFGASFPLPVGEPLPAQLAVIAQVDRALDGEGSPDEDVPWGNSILEVQTQPLIDTGGAMLGAICVARDVTQVRAMEEQVRRVEKLAAIGELAAGAAHEIRNPLTSIRGFIQLLQVRASRADGDYFQIILNEIDRIDWIIRDMLLLARPNEVVRIDTDLSALLDEVLVMQQTELQRQNIAVSRELRSVGSIAAVDPKMIRQLLLNLVINATQAMPYGGTLGLLLHHADEGHIALSVSDTGVGIPAENLKRLFVPFFTTKEEGTGLGLALCYSIVQAHGGKIDVESEVGLGTTFIITLPIRHESAAVASR